MTELLHALSRLSLEDLAQMAIRAGRMLGGHREWWHDDLAARPTLVESW